MFILLLFYYFYILLLFHVYFIILHFILFPFLTWLSCQYFMIVIQLFKICQDAVL